MMLVNKKNDCGAGGGNEMMACSPVGDKPVMVSCWRLWSCFGGVGGGVGGMVLAGSKFWFLAVLIISCV